MVNYYNNKEYYRKVKISRNDHARAYIDKLKHTNKGFHFFVSERRIFEGQPINRAILTHPETIVIQHNISDTTPRKRKYLEQLLQDLQKQYPEAKEVEGEVRKIFDPTIYIWFDNTILDVNKIMLLQDKLKEAFSYTLFNVAYKIKFVKEQEKIKKWQDYDSCCAGSIWIYFTSENKINFYVPGKNIYNSAFGIIGQTPVDRNYPIWIKVNKHVNIHGYQYDSLAFITMHELGHRLTDLALAYTYNPVEIILKYSVSKHDNQKTNLMMEGSKKIENMSLKEMKNKGFFSILPERRKIIQKYFVFLKRIKINE